MALRELVERGMILRATVGSTVHGLHHGGQDDRDEMAVFVEPPEYRLGLKLARAQGRKLHPLEHWVERTQPEGVRSGPGRPRSRRLQPAQVRRLALKGHPTVLLLLFVPARADASSRRSSGASCGPAPARSSRSAPVAATSATCTASASGCSARAGQKRVNRPELVEAHGYDTKYAMHALRLGYQGLELLETGRVTLPMAEPERSRVMAIRLGERTFDEVIAEIDEVERRWRRRSSEPAARGARPRRRRRFLVDAYRRAWGWGESRGPGPPERGAGQTHRPRWVGIRHRSARRLQHDPDPSHSIGRTEKEMTMRTDDETSFRADEQTEARITRPRARVERGDAKSSGRRKELLEKLGNDDLCRVTRKGVSRTAAVTEVPLSTAADATTTTGSREAPRASVAQRKSTGLRTRAQRFEASRGLARGCGEIGRRTGLRNRRSDP